MRMWPVCVLLTVFARKPARARRRLVLGLAGGGVRRLGGVDAPAVERSDPALAVPDVRLTDEALTAGAVCLSVPRRAVLFDQPHLPAVDPRWPELVPHAAIALGTDAEAMVHPGVTVHLHPVVVLLLTHGKEKGGGGGGGMVRRVAETR